MPRNLSQNLRNLSMQNVSLLMGMAKGMLDMAYRILHIELVQIVADR
jgi:hypothetical protein